MTNQIRRGVLGDALVLAGTVGTSGAAYMLGGVAGLSLVVGALAIAAGAVLALRAER